MWARAAMAALACVVSFGAIHQTHFPIDHTGHEAVCRPAAITKSIKVVKVKRTEIAGTSAGWGKSTQPARSRRRRVARVRRQRWSDCVCDLPRRRPALRPRTATVAGGAFEAPMAVAFARPAA
jgi:hypothetical protein